MNTEERIEKAVNEAEDAFWSVIAERFPEAETGDLFFDASIEFGDECRSVVRLWIATNTNLLPNHWASDDDIIDYGEYWGGIPSSSSGSLVILPTETGENYFPLDE